MVIEHEPTGVVAEANERRSLEENRQMAIHRLRVRLAATVRSESSQMNQLSELWRKRTMSGKMIVSDLHVDFPALLAEALDRLSIAQFQTSEAAKSLRVTTTSLVNLFAKSAEALSIVNRERSARGMPKLRLS
jgi:hypothetical protein